MRENDILTKTYFSDPKRFAELFNTFLFSGREVIDPDKLSEVDPNEIINNRAKKILNEKERDLKKVAKLMSDGKTDFLLYLGLENQSLVDYGMPVRVMSYDVAGYEKQIRKLISDSTHFSIGLPKGNRLSPVVTLVLYWGEDDWDGPESLYDLFEEEISSQFKDYISDYKINVICPYRMKDEQIESLKTDLREVFAILKCRSDVDALERIQTDQRNSYSALRSDTAQIISKYLNIEIDDYEEGGKVNMCKAVEELKLRERNRGIEQGITQEKVNSEKQDQKHIVNMFNNLKNAYTELSDDKLISTIAESFDRSETDVRNILCL